MQQQLINNIITSKAKPAYKPSDELSYKTMLINTTGKIGDTDYNHSNDYNYDILGNLKNKSGAGYIETGVGGYHYNNKPHAISSAGGIATELGGGKFANGAQTAAFVHLFNHEWEKLRTIYPGKSRVLKGKRYFKTEPRNTNIFSISDGFHYTAKGHQTDSYGEIIPSVASPNWGKYTSGYDAIIDVGRPSQYGNRLNVNINTNVQPSNGNSNTNGWYINIYTSD